MNAQELRAIRTARAIRAISERHGLKVTDDVELAWRDAILYANTETINDGKE